MASCFLAIYLLQVEVYLWESGNKQVLEAPAKEEPLWQLRVHTLDPNLNTERHKKVSLCLNSGLTGAEEKISLFMKKSNE